MTHSMRWSAPRNLLFKTFIDRSFKTSWIFPSHPLTSFMRSSEVGLGGQSASLTTKTVKTFLRWDNCIHPFRLFHIFLHPKHTRFCNFWPRPQKVANYSVVSQEIDRKLCCLFIYSCCHTLDFACPHFSPGVPDRYSKLGLQRLSKDRDRPCFKWTVPDIELELVYSGRFLKFTRYFDFVRIIAARIFSRPTHFRNLKKSISIF